MANQTARQFPHLELDPSLGTASLKVVDRADGHLCHHFGRQSQVRQGMSIYQMRQPTAKLFWEILFILPLLAQCGGGQPSVDVQGAYKGAVEVGNNIIAMVNKQAIQPFLIDNPVTPDGVEVGFTPKYIPVRLAVDAEGNIFISSSSTIVTDIGVFDATTSKKVISQEKGNLLIIEIDDQVAIYELPLPNSNESFKVDFSDKYSKYRILTFEYSVNGNVILKLESLEINR